MFILGLWASAVWTFHLEVIGKGPLSGFSTSHFQRWCIAASGLSSARGFPSSLPSEGLTESYPNLRSTREGARQSLGLYAFAPSKQGLGGSLEQEDLIQIRPVTHVRLLFTTTMAVWIQAPKSCPDVLRSISNPNPEPISPNRCS